MCQPRNHFHQTRKSSSHTVIMQFEFSVIFVRNFSCLLGTLQTKSMGLIGNSISPEQQRPSFAHCTMHVYNYCCVIHTCTCCLLFAYYLNLQVSGTCTVADILTGGNYSEFFALQCSYDLEVSQICAVLSDKNTPLVHLHVIFACTCQLMYYWLHLHVMM